MFIRILHVCTGLFVVATVLLLLLLATKVSQVSSVENPLHLQARFTNVEGLKQGAKVALGGLVIGRIRLLELDKKSFQIIAHLDIENSYTNTIPTDSAAAIVTAGLLGEKFIRLLPGGEEVYLQDGDSLLQTQSAVSLEDLIGKFISPTK